MPPGSPTPAPDSPTRALVRALAAATAFLTRLPGDRQPPPLDLVRAGPLFPLVGALVGALVATTAAGLANVLPALLAATLAVALELAITGVLHVDGLADSADGLAGGDPERALEIMRDHSLGAYGASTLVLVLLAKATALAALAERGDVAPVVAAYAVSRAAPLPLAALLPYARPGGGIGRLLADRLGARHALAGLALAAALATAATGAWAVVAIGCLLVTAVAVGALTRRRLGGVTGDVMGAAIELTATLTLVAAVASAG